MKKIILIIIFLFINECISQIPVQKTIGGSSYEYGYSFLQTNDSGYIIAGITWSYGAGNGDVYVVRITSNGTLGWTRTFGGGNIDYAYSIIQTLDSGYAIAGYTNSFGIYTNNIFIVKISSNGTFQWSKTIGGTRDERSYSIIQNIDSSYILVGSSNSFGSGEGDMIMIKLDVNGSLIWSKTIGGIDVDCAESVIKTIDGGYAIAGYTYSFGAGLSDIYVVKTDLNGNIIWSKTVGGTNYDGASAIIQSTDGGYVIAGTTTSFGAGNQDIYIVKLSSSGMLSWTKTFGGNSVDGGNTISPTRDGGYIAAGSTYSYGGGGEYNYIVKLDINGTYQWSRTIGGSGVDEFAYSIKQTLDGGFAMVGHTYSLGSGGGDVYLIKTDSSGYTCGNITSPNTISGSGGILGSPTSTVNLVTPNVITRTPSISSGGNLSIICLSKIHMISKEIPKYFNLSQNYPNPFNPITKIMFNVPLSRGVPERRGVLTRLTVYDILGREVATLVNEKLSPGTYEVEWDASDYPSGVYLYKLMSGDFNQAKRMVLIK